MWSALHQLQLYFELCSCGVSIFTMSTTLGSKEQLDGNRSPKGSQGYQCNSVSTDNPIGEKKALSRNW